MPQYHHHLKSLRFYFLVVSVFVPHLIISSTTMTRFFVNDTRTFLQNGNRSIKFRVPVYSHSFNITNSTLIKLRRLEDRKEIVNESQVTKSVVPVKHDVELQLKAPGSSNPGVEGEHVPQKVSQPNYQYQQPEYSYMQPPAPYQHEVIQQPLYYPEEHKTKEPEEEKEDEPPEIEDKVFTKAIVGTKAVKILAFIFSFFTIFVVLVLAVLSKLGVALTPIALPFAVLPVGLAAMFLFVPLFAAFVPVAVVEVESQKSERRPRFIEENNEYILQTLEANIGQLLDHWQPTRLLSPRLQKYINSFR